MTVVNLMRKKNQKLKDFLNKLCARQKKVQILKYFEILGCFVAKSNLREVNMQFLQVKLNGHNVPGHP